MPTGYIYLDEKDMKKLNSGEKVEIEMNFRLQQCGKMILRAIPNSENGNKKEETK